MTLRNVVFGALFLQLFAGLVTDLWVGEFRRMPWSLTGFYGFWTVLLTFLWWHGLLQ